MMFDFTEADRKLHYLNKHMESFFKEYEQMLFASSPVIVARIENKTEAVLTLELKECFDGEYLMSRFYHILGDFSKILDYLVYEVSGKNKFRKIYFPYCEEESKLKKENFKDVPEKFFNKIKALQPYNGCWQCSEINQNALVVLKKIINHEKHIGPVFFSSNPDLIEAKFCIKFENELNVLAFEEPDISHQDFELKDGCVIATIKTKNNIDNIDGIFNFHMEPWIAYDGYRYNLRWCLESASLIASVIVGEFKTANNEA